MQHRVSSYAVSCDGVVSGWRAASGASDHNTQASCSNGAWGATGPATNPAQCDGQGFCSSDGDNAALPCPCPPPQTGDWPAAYGVTTN